MWLISSCLANIAMSGELQLRPHHETLLSTLFARVQILVDEICATVPFLTGDVEEVVSGVVAVLVPARSSMPSMESARQFTQQAVASGLYLMYMTLRTVLDFHTCDKVIASSLRAGQKEWIVRQVNRLRRILQCI